MNTSSFLRPKPEIRLDYSSDSQRHKQNAFYVPSASRSKHAKHSATTRGYTSDSGHAAPATSAPASSRVYEPSRQRTDPGTSYAYTTQASSSSKHPYPTDTYTASRPQQPPGASTATPSYDSRAYAQRAPDRTTTATPSHHSRPHETSKPSRHRAHDHAIPPAAPPTPQPYAVPATAESHRSGHRSRRHAEDSQRATERAQAEANARAQAEAAARAQEAAARARAEAERARLAAEEAERAKEKAAAKARRRELRAQQEAEAKRQLEMQAEVEKRRRKEEKRAERRRAELEAERQRAEQERLRLQPSTSREAAQHPRVVSAKESRTARVKDSDESDNSARRYAPSVKSRHQRYASAPAAATLAPATAGSSPGQPIQQIQVPAVSSSQTSYPRQPAGYPDNAPASSRETLRQYPTAAPPSRPKHTKGASWSHNASAPYPPGYAVSGSDSEAAVRKPQRLKKPYRPSRAPADTPAAAAPAAPAPVAPTMSRSSSKGKTLGDMANWLFNRSDSKQDKKAANGGTSAPAADVQQQQQQQQQPPGVATVPLPARSAPSPVVSIKAGQGPSDGNFVRQRTNSSSGQPNPVDPRSVQAQTNQIPSHIEVLMQAHAASQPSMDTRQGYPSPAHQAVQSMAPSPPVLQPPKPSHTASQPSVYQSQSYVASASHLATVAPSITVPSPSPGAPQAPTSAPPHPTAAYNTYSHAAPYGQQTSATAVSRSGYAGREVPERNQTTPAPTSRYKSSPPRENVQQSSYAIPDSTGRYPTAPDGPQVPSYNRQVDSKATVTSPPPANEDSPGRTSHRQHTRRPSTASLRPQTRDEQRLAATAQQTGYTYAIDPRATRTTKTSSPGQNPSNVPPTSTPPKNTSQPIPSPHALPQAPSASYAYDPSRSHAPISQPSTYPDTIVYPTSASRVDAAHAQPTVAPNSSYNSSSRTASGNPSRYQSSSNPQPQSQPHAYPVATHISARSASNDTGSTTLVGHTPPQFMSAIASEARATELPSSSPGSRHPVAVPAVAPSASSGRHHSSRHHSDSPPQTTPPTVQPPIPSTKTSSHANYPSNIAVPQPARSFTTPETRRTNTPAPIRIPARDFSSPGISDDLNTPSSLEHTPKELYANTLHPVTTTQSLPEGKKKASFFGGFFRPRTGTKPGPNEHILQPKTPEPRTTRQQPQSAKPSSSSAAKAPLPFPTDDARKASRRERAPSPDATPSATYANPPAYDTVAKKDGRQYRLFDKRLRTVSGLSAEAVDGTNAGASTVRASPASSLRSSTPRLSPPFRDPVQATYDWRDRAEADEYGRSSMRRRRPGVTFDGYDELPQAESHDMPYVRRMAARRQPIPQQLIEQT